MKIIIICLLLPIIYSAQTPNHNYIANVAKKYNDRRSWVVIPIILHNKKGHLFIGNTRLYNYYLKNDKIQKLKYYDFLEELLKNKILVNLDSFNLTNNDIDDDTTIVNSYNQKGLKFIEKRFFEANSGHLLIKRTIDKKLYKTLAFIMFSNNYYINHSDYTGCFYFYR